MQGVSHLRGVGWGGWNHPQMWILGGMEVCPDGSDFCLLPCASPLLLGRWDLDS